MILTTDCIREQHDYILPEEIITPIELRIYNEKKKEWRDGTFKVYLKIGKMLKTDRKLRITLNDGIKKHNELS